MIKYYNAKLREKYYENYNYFHLMQPMYYVPVPSGRKEEDNNSCGYICLGVFLSLVIISAGLFCVANLDLESLSGFFQEQTNVIQEKGEIQEAFDDFLLTYGKEYISEKESKKRFEIFAKNYRKIMRHNQGYHSYTMGINQFTDMTEEEFEEYLGTFKPEFPDTAEEFDASNPIVGDIDWVSLQKVPAIKNQGQCGSCWAFASIGVIESFRAIKMGQTTPNIVTYSEQQLVDCDTGDYGCNGGWMSTAYTYIVSKGISTSAKYPYKAVKQTCQTIYKDYTITGYISIAANNPATMITALNSQPIAVALAANALQYYAGGILQSADCTGDINHGVILVGVGSASGSLYWKLRNSWGAGWGESGYFRIQRDNTNTGQACQVLTYGGYQVK